MLHKGRKYMDKIDKKLIELLQENARYSLKQLSEQVFLSSPAVASRILKLEESKLISGYHAQIDSEKLGYHIGAYVNVSMEPKQKEDFIAFAKKCPNVIECSTVAGDSTMILKAMFASTIDLDNFIVEVQRYGTTQTQIIISEPIPRRNIIVEADAN